MGIFFRHFQNLVGLWAHTHPGATSSPQKAANPDDAPPPAPAAYLSVAPQRVASEEGDSGCSPGTRAGSWASPLPWATRHTCTASGESWAAARPAELCPPCRDVVMVVGQGSRELSTARRQQGRAGCEQCRAGAGSERPAGAVTGPPALTAGRGGWDTVGRGAGEGRGRGRRRRVGTWRVGTGRSGAGGGEDGAPAWRALRVARALGGAGVTSQLRGTAASGSSGPVAAFPGGQPSTGSIRESHRPSATLG